MLRRFFDSILALHGFYLVLLLAGLPLTLGVMVVMCWPASPSVRVVQSVGGEVFDPFVTTTSGQIQSILRTIVFREPLPKDLYLGPRDQSRMYLQQVYNDQLTDEAIFKIDVSEIGHLRVVDMSGPHVTDRGFSHIAANPLVHNVSCRNARVTDAGLAAIEQNHGLYSLDLSGNNITDAGMSSAARFPRLGVLCLCNTRISDQAIQELASRGSRITSLDIASTHVTTEGLARMQQIRRLNAVGLDVTQFSEEALQILQAFNLSSLSVGTCSERKNKELLQQAASVPSRIDDQVVSRIARLSTLTGICLFGGTLDESTTLTIESVKSLRSMPNLTYLNFVDLTVDPAVIQQLRQQIPALQVMFNGR